MRRLLIALVIAAQSRDALAAPTAEELYDQGKRAYDHGDYAIAILNWERSYAMSSEPELLFNLAQANRLFGDCVYALGNYKRFIALDPTSDKRALTDGFVHELEPKCGTPVAPARPLTVDHPSTSSPGRTMKLAGFAVGSAGAILLVTGVGLGHHASTLGDEVTHACAVTCDWAAQKDRDAAGRRDAAIGDVLDVVGIAAIVGGAVVYYLGEREGAISISPRVHEASAVVSWSGSW